MAPNQSVKYLGRDLTFSEYHDQEIRHRINCGWAKFTANKDILCDRHYPLKQRFRLFNNIVTPCVLYGCGSWTMTEARRSRLKVTQRQMLRKIVQTPRGTDEDWVPYLKRATAIAEDLSSRAGIESWITGQRRKKWRWGGHIARLTDRRWAQLTFWWVPDGSRQRGRPVFTWEHEFKHFFEEKCWYDIAKDRKTWKTYEDAFAQSR